MSFRTWQRIVWTYHVAFALAVTWPVQTFVNAPSPFVLGLPRQMAWCAAWVLGSAVVLWRLDRARTRATRARTRTTHEPDPRAAR